VLRKSRIRPRIDYLGGIIKSVSFKVKRTEITGTQKSVGLISLSVAISCLLQTKQINKGLILLNNLFKREGLSERQRETGRD